MPLEFCSVCENYLYLDTSNDKLTKSCKTCGYQKETTEGSLITETVIQAQSSEDYRYVVNEFTKQDPRLPRFKNLKCPKADCPTQNGVPSEVIVIKYDQKNLRFVYICSVCDETWRSGSR